jgi:hypothetical protein
MAILQEIVHWGLTGAHEEILRDDVDAAFPEAEA